MFKCDFAYYAPKSLPEALELVKEGKSDTFLIAGGTDLLLSIKKEIACPAAIIDLKKLPELRYIKEDNGYIKIGAAVSFSSLVESELINKKAGALSDAAAEMGSPQVRSRATIGGNIATASPAADSVPPLIVLGARVVLKSEAGERELPLEEFFNGVNKTKLQPNEILTEVNFKVPEPRCASAFVKLGRRKALSIARLSTAVFLRKKTNSSSLQDVKVSIGAAAENPFRVKEIEDYLTGNNISEAVLENTLNLFSEATASVLGSRKSAPFKRESIKGVAGKALFQAFNRLKE